MQTLISRARDISPRAGRCNISRKRVVSLFHHLSPSPLSLCKLCLLVACTSRLRSNYSLRVSVTKLRDLSSNRQRRRRRRHMSKNPTNFRFAETKLVSLSREEDALFRLSFSFSPRRTRDASWCIAYVLARVSAWETVRDRTWPCVLVRVQCARYMASRSSSRERGAKIC